MNKFFFILSYDNFSGAMLASLLNLHPEIKVQTSFTDPSPAVFNDASKNHNIRIDPFILQNTDRANKINGSAQRFAAFDLQHKTLIEKTKTPHITANILMSPYLRVKLILRYWNQHNLSEEFITKQIENQLRVMREKNHSLFQSYIYHYYYGQVSQSVHVDNLVDGNDSKNKLFIQALALVLAHDCADIPTSSKKFHFEKLINDHNVFNDFAKHLTRGGVEFNEAYHEQVKAGLLGYQKDLANLEAEILEPWQAALINKFLNAKLQTIYYPHIDKTLNELYLDQGYHLTPSVSDKPQYSKLISIQLNSNRPAQLYAYLDNIEETTDDPSSIEVLVNIDIGSLAMKTMLDKEIPLRKFTLKYIETPRPKSFCDLWRPINELLKVTDPDAYFLLNISDEMFFLTKGWDSILKKYVGYFPDHLFRLRASRNKFRNYFDRWECSFAQDSIPFTTKKWVDIGGDWNPCFGPDSFQQLIAFYLAKEGQFSNTNYLREAPMTEIKFGGDVPAIGIEADKSWRHNQDHIIAMQICQSPKMQLEARKRAMRIKANIIAQANYKNFTINDNSAKKHFSIIDNDTNTIVEKIDYKVNALLITLTNNWRKLAFFSYFGDGRKSRKSIFRSFTQYQKARHMRVRKTIEVIMAFIEILKARRVRKVLAIPQKIKNYYNNHPLKEENHYLKERYEAACIENEKLINELIKNTSSNEVEKSNAVKQDKTFKTMV